MSIRNSNLFLRNLNRRCKKINELLIKTIKKERKFCLANCLVRRKSFCEKSNCTLKKRSSARKKTNNNSKNVVTRN